MHIAGINWVAVLLAATAFFAVGYVIHMRLVDLRPGMLPSTSTTLN